MKMKVIKISRYLSIVLLTCVLLLNSGCWSRRELEDLAFILAMGIDKDEELGIRIFAQIGEAEQQGAGGAEEGGGGEITVLEGTGRTVSAAYDQLFEVSSRRPFLSHMKIVLIGEELAQDGIREILDFLKRDLRVRNNTVMLLAQGDLKVMLEAEPTIGGVPALVLDETVRFNWERSKTFRNELFQLNRDMVEDDIELILPMVMEQGDMIAVRNSAYFDNYSMKGTLDNRQTLGYLWLSSDVRHGVITVSPEKEENRYVTFLMKNTRVKINPVEQDNELTFFIDIYQRTTISDNQTNLSIEEMEQEISTYIKNTVLDTINTAQEAGIDFIGFGKRYKRKYPRRWDEKTWQQKFSEAEVIIRVEAEINSEER